VACFFFTFAFFTFIITANLSLLASLAIASLAKQNKQGMTSKAVIPLLAKQLLRLLRKKGGVAPFS
jgi:hypothetical protein